MKIFKTIDDKFAEIGFTKVKEDKHGISYTRYNKKYNFTQCLDILYKEYGANIIQSYDVNLHDTKGIGNTCVGLTMYEAKLCIKKMKQWMKKYKIKDNKEIY